MNLKKFISGISALTIAASAFAGMAVTASADDTVVLQRNGSEANASTDRYLYTTGTAASDSLDSTNLGTMTLSRSGGNSGNGSVYIFDNTTYTVIDTAISHADASDKYYLLHAYNGSNGSASHSATITSNESVNTYGTLEASFALPEVHNTVSGTARTNAGLEVVIGNIAKIVLDTGTAAAPYNMTIAAADGTGYAITGDTTFSNLGYNTWVDAELAFNLSNDTAKLTLTNGSTTTETYFTNVTASSVSAIIFRAYTKRSNESRFNGAVAFDDVVLTKLDNPPTTTASNAAVLTVKCGTAEDDDLLGTYDIACLKGETVDITTDSNYKAYYDVDGYRYTKASGETSVEITGATQTAKLVYTQGAIPDVNVVINAVNAGGTESHKLTEISKKDDQNFYYTLTRYIKFDDGYYYKYNTFGSNCEVKGTAQENMNPVNVVYTQTANEYFYEAEDYVTDTSFIGYQNGVSSRHSSGSAVWGLGYLSNSASVTTTPELPAGTYTVTIGYRPSPANRAFALFNGSTGEKVYTSGLTGSGGGYNTEVAVENVYIKDNGYVYLKGTNVGDNNYATPEIDYIAIARTGDLPNYAITNENENVSVAATGTLYSTVTISPASGYEFRSAPTVMGVDGTTEITVTAKGDGTYTFTMPAQAVTVTATATATVVEPTVSISEVDSQTINYKDATYTAAKLLVNVVGSVSGINVTYKAANKTMKATDMTAITNGTIVLGAIVEDGVTVNENTFSVDVAPAE